MAVAHPEYPPLLSQNNLNTTCSRLEQISPFRQQYKRDKTMLANQRPGNTIPIYKL